VRPMNCTIQNGGLKMAKRMIDADALLVWIRVTKGLFDDETLDDFYLSTLNKINELSTPAPVAQKQFWRDYLNDKNLNDFYLNYFGHPITQVKENIKNDLIKNKSPAPIAQGDVKNIPNENLVFLEKHFPSISENISLGFELECAFHIQGDGYWLEKRRDGLHIVWHYMCPSIKKPTERRTLSDNISYLLMNLYASVTSHDCTYLPWRPLPKIPQSKEGV
jgi:hypothetical protein